MICAAVSCVVVEEYSPMKRGLKGENSDEIDVGRRVEEYSPMKRGLKDARRIRRARSHHR